MGESVKPLAAGGERKSEQTEAPIAASSAENECALGAPPGAAQSASSNAAPREERPAQQEGGEEPLEEGPARQEGSETPLEEGPARQEGGEEPREEGPARQESGEEPREERAVSQAGGEAPIAAAQAQPKRRGLRLELDNKDPEYKNSKEKVYDFLSDKLHLTVRAMDIVIAALVVLLIIFLVIGFLKGDGGYIA